ncbi:MAG: hypothetical protein RSA41_08055, partial [Christensenella sp.]
DAFLKARTNDFKKGADAYVSDIFAGKAQPSDGLTGSAEPGDKFDYTDGDLADQFTQGLFGEDYLRKRFVDKELGKFKPMLEEKASTLEKRIKQKNAGDSSQNAQSTVYNGSKGARLLSEEIRPQPTQIPQAGAKTGGVDWSQMWNAAPQYEVAGKKNAEQNTSKPKQPTISELLELDDDELIKRGLDRNSLLPVQPTQGNLDIEKRRFDELQREAEANISGFDKFVADFKIDPVETGLEPMVGKIRNIAANEIKENGMPNGEQLQRKTDSMSDEDVIKWYEKVKKSGIGKVIAGAVAAGTSAYDNEDEAAKAFLQQARGKENWNTKEYEGMMVTMKVPQTDEEGQTTVMNKTILFPVMEGGERDVINPVVSEWIGMRAAERFCKAVGAEAPIVGMSFIHSHPQDGSGIVDEFSNGDRIVGMAPGVANMYRVDGDDGDIWRYNEMEEQMYPRQSKDDENYDLAKGNIHKGEYIYKGKKIN